MAALEKRSVLLAKYSSLDRINSLLCRGSHHGRTEKCKHSELISREVLENNDNICPVKRCKKKHTLHWNKFVVDEEVSGALNVLKEALPEVVQDILCLATHVMVREESVDKDILSSLQNITLYLKDPQSFQEIKIPVRGPQCTHPNCFDLSTYLTDYQKAGGLCPLCLEPAPACQLIVYEGYVELLRERRSKLQAASEADMEFEDLDSDMEVSTWGFLTYRTSCPGL